MLLLQREETSQALAARDAEVATLTRQLGERPDESYWRGCVETEGRRYHELMVRYEQKAEELGAAQLKYSQLKE